MQDASPTPPLTDDELPASLLEALRALPSEQGSPSRETDVAIMQMAAANLALIRRRATITRAVVGIFAAAACFALVFQAIRRPEPSTNPTAPVAKQEEDAAAVILREVSALFPHQVQAIVKDSSGLRFCLSDKPDVKPGPAVVLQVCNRSACEEIITFGGQKIHIAGHKVTVQTDAGGKVSLDGDTFLWSSDLKGSTLHNLQIASRRL